VAKTTDKVTIINCMRSDEKVVYRNAVQVLMTTCAGAKKDEAILFVTDDTSKEISEVMWNHTRDFPNRAIAMMPDRRMHGDEPPAAIAAAMANADIIFGITKFSMFHTNARRNAVKNGARFVNMADYSTDMMKEGGLFADFIAQGKLLDRLSDVLEGNTARITSDAGTNISFSIEGRKAIRQYGRSIKPGSSSSPPDIETALGPVEGTANGVVVIDGGIPHPELGVLKGKIKLTLKDGRIVSIEGGEEAVILERVLRDMNDDAVYALGEMGIGLNNKSKLCNRMLEDEGVMGTIHFGFGSNITFGGTIESNNHLDMIFKAPTLSIDGRTLMVRGELTID
jgi:2,5-dihydroxypyridine 5,6-dioxygenase